MASYNKFQDFVEQLLKGVHQLHAAGHTIECYLSNEQPLVADTIKADIAEIAIENGYTGAEDAQNDVTEAPAGTANLTCVDIQIEAAGGTIGPFQFVVMFNETAAAPVDALIAWWDYGSAITLQDAETFDIDFAATTFTLT
ncbi:hypothetical protein KAR91_33535 [Candidatus Pacearchaeota archaeon]|nr:hypothetical protein [Candidatus Pacearchaeota archaeon]